MTIRTSLASSVLALGLVLLACGGSSSSSSGDGGADGAAPTPGACGQIGGGCSGEGTCCTVTVPDGFGPEGYRCVSSAWQRDTSCDPPPAPCTAPLTGSLKRGDGTTVLPTCLLPGGSNGVVGASIAVSTGGQLQLVFDRLPVAGDVVPVVPRTVGPRPDAGAGDAGANAVQIGVGRPGGFSGFAVEAESASGTMTVTSIQTDGATGFITALHVTLDAQMSGPATTPAWSGKLSGSW
jgi:hypothetical protein